MIGWFNLFSLGIGMIIFTYCCSFLFQKVKTASAWFSLINIIFGFIVMPMVIFGKDNIFGYFSFLKYFYPYFDVAVKVFLKNGNNQQLAQLANVDVPDGSTLWYSVIFYIVILILI